MDQKKIATKIRAYRKKNQLSQEEFSDMIGIDIDALKEIEKGLRLPRLEELFNLIYNSSIEPNYLFAMGRRKKAMQTIDYEIMNLMDENDKDFKHYLYSLINQ